MFDAFLLVPEEKIKDKLSKKKDSSEGSHFLLQQIYFCQRLVSLPTLLLYF